jgi:crossover junction endodeoxyribonuclease RuvC
MGDKEPVIIAVDPGLDGAVALRDRHYVAVMDLPTHVARGGKRRSLDLVGLNGMLQATFSAGRDVIALIEDVHAMPKQGVTSVFTFGRTFGELRGVLVTLGARVLMVRPTAWKRGVGLPPKADKDAARAMAVERNPDLAHMLKRKKDHNRAEAVLMSQYARMLYKSGGI